MVASKACFNVALSAVLLPLYTALLRSLSAFCSVRVFSFSVEPTREHVDHGHDELMAFWFFVLLIENDEICLTATQLGVDELDSKAGKVVFVGNHNFFDHAFVEFVQKPRKAFVFVLEARGDVDEDLVFRVACLHRLDLPLKVVRLFAAGDTTLDDSRFL
jgi:hypothetical protein